MQIKTQEHFKHDWISHDLLKDFEVEDVWRFPVILEEEDSLEQFRGSMLQTLEALHHKGLAGALFQLRLFLGKIFQWDEEAKSHSPLIPGSIRARYAEQFGLSADQLPPPGNQEFIPVYELENEALSEIENATVHAAMHLGKVSFSKNKMTVQMAVYVKPKGMLGRFYMGLIKPFRHAIVYPALMQQVGRDWKERKGVVI